MGEMCPEGNPQMEAPFIERGWTDRDGGRWTSCPCGRAHRRPRPPVDTSWIQMEPRPKPMNGRLWAIAFGIVAVVVLALAGWALVESVAAMNDLNGIAP